MVTDFSAVIANELKVSDGSVRAVSELLGKGATVPFIARYRKEATGGMDEVQIRLIAERGGYLRDLAERKKTVIEEIERQGKLTAALRAEIEGCMVKSALEDLYLPFKPRRRTRALIARERGLEALAQRILSQPRDGDPGVEALGFVAESKGVATAKDALAGARDIVAEALAETASVRAFARETYMKEGVLAVRKAPEVSGPTKFEMYYDFREACAKLPSHRLLAVRRGEAENVLRSEIELDSERVHTEIARVAKRNPGSPWAVELDLAIGDAWKRLIAPSVESEVRVELKLVADRAAVEVFAQNLRALLMSAPLGARAVIGIDPGQRTGCKVAVVDATGSFLESATLFLVQGAQALEKSRETLKNLLERFKPFAVAVGNGTHGRETESFVRETLAVGSGVTVVMVSESGASVYSASEEARGELAELDLTVRGAISIARRLQDPLAELVKVDPKAIGVGQYQHDVYQPLLGRKLQEVVESCVNQVGVELNTASASLLGHVAGIGESLAKRIVAHRQTHGPFGARTELLEVAGVGPRTFEQAAGFLRIRGAKNAMDASAVHPERYELVRAMAGELGTEVSALVGNAALAAKIQWQRYLGEGIGEPTLKDIIEEIKKPGRDPRADFEAPKFRDDVRAIEDLKPGMTLEGVVTNVTAFGAFVDIGVHQDGLVHVSQLSDRFVKSPSEVVAAGDRLKVRVLEVDLVRKRIGLSAKSGAVPSQGAYGAKPERKAAPKGAMSGAVQPSFKNNPFDRLLKK